MRRKSIRNKIMAAIVGITFLAVISIAAVFYMESSQMIEENYVAALQQRIGLLTETVDEKLKEVCVIGINAACDERVKEDLSEYLNTGEESKLENIAELLRLYKRREDLITSVCLLIPDTSQVITSMDYPVYKSGIDAETVRCYAQAVQEKPAPAVIRDILNHEKKILSFIETVRDENGKEIGYLCTNVEENKLFYDYFDNTEDRELENLLLLNPEQIVIAGKQFQMGEVYSETKMPDLSTLKADTAGADQKTIYVYCEGKFSGCHIFAQAERDVILEDLSRSGGRIMLIAVLFILFSLFPAAYLTGVVTKPVRKLVEAMQCIGQGSMDTRVEVVSGDEIGVMSAEFNRMLDQIQELIRQVILEGERKKDAELEALQYQITPHFMYNTLNAVKYSALLKGEQEIAGVIGDFTELLQACISKKGAFFTVSEEVSILEKYIALQEFRYGEKIHVEYEVDQRAAQCLIPRLILQPLVENALIHGMDFKQKNGKLIIRAWVDREVLHLEVADNGRGMTQEQIESLLMSKSKKTKGLTAIGVPNVRDRLKLYYKEKAELSYISSSAGTTAIIYLPEIKDEE